MDADVREKILVEVREKQSPYFDVEDIEHYYEKNKHDVEATIYELLIIKSEDSSIQVSGLTTQDTGKYFRMLAQKYRRYNSGVLKS